MIIEVFLASALGSLSGAGLVTVAMGYYVKKKKAEATSNVGDFSKAMEGMVENMTENLEDEDLFDEDGSK